MLTLMGEWLLSHWVIYISCCCFHLCLFVFFFIPPDLRSIFFEMTEHIYAVCNYVLIVLLWYNYWLKKKWFVFIVGKGISIILN